MKKYSFGVASFLLITVLSIFATPAHAGEAYLYQGQSGFSRSFSLIGGQYSLYVNAHYFNPYKTYGAQSCIFSANFQRVWPDHDESQLGGAAPITNPVHYNLGPKVLTLPAGRYTIYVASATDCQWTFSLESTNANSAGIGPVQMFAEKKDGGLQPSDTASVSDKVEFYAQYRTARDAQAPASGELQIIHNGKVIQRFPLQVGNDAAKASVFNLYVQWEQSDARYAGKNTAKFVVKIGGTEFTSTADFMLTQ